MQETRPPSWQHPFVDIFKTYKTFQSSMQAISGSVVPMQDSIIGRKVFKLSGSVLSSNYLLIPDPLRDKSLQLQGRYIYVQLYTFPEKYFVIHFEIKIIDRQPNIKFTLTNMQSELLVVGVNTLKIPFPKNLINRWTILCIDIRYLLQNSGLFTKGAIKNYQKCHILKSIQICSNLMVRGIYTSNNIYNFQTLPKEMGFKLQTKSKPQFQFLYIPESLSPCQISKKLREKNKDKKEQESQQSLSQQIKRSIIRQKSLPKQQKPSNPLSPYPILELNHSLSFSPLLNIDIAISKSKISYTSGSIIININNQTGQQTFLQGHTQNICAFDVFQDIMVSAQGGKKSVVRIWIKQKCICSFQGPYDKIQQIRLSKKGLLAMLGSDYHNRQIIIIFSIQEIQTKKKPQFIAKQVCDFHINTIKFSPSDQNRLVSCGKQNIKFWRIKFQHLPGAPVILNQHARNSFFTVLDFLMAYDDPSAALQGQLTKKVFVGSKAGLLFQINYSTQQLEQVFKIHQGSICSIVVSAGYCITGGEDQLLRVWPIDFEDYILQAQHQGQICSLNTSQDGTLVVCGTLSGGMGVLDLTNHNYKTIMRSHTGPIIQINLHSYSGMLISLSEDLTIRIWDINKHEQTYEFTYPKQDLCTRIVPNPVGMYFTAGFVSGIFRVFDIQKTCIVNQFKFHQASITAIAYSYNGKYLIVADKNCFYCVYDALRGYQPIKTLQRQIKSQYQSIAFVSDNKYFATIGDSGTHINLYDTKSFNQTLSIFTSNTTAYKLKFSKLNHLFILTVSCGMKVYSLNMGNLNLIHDIPPMHRAKINDIDFSPQCSYIVSVGADSLVKIWDYQWKKEPHQVFVAHVQESTSVVWKDNRIYTSGMQQAIYQWKFLGSQEEIKDQNIEKLDFQLEQINKVQKEKIDDEERKEVEEEILDLEKKYKVDFMDLDQRNLTLSQKMKRRVQCSKKDINETKFNPYKIPLNFFLTQIQFKKFRKKQTKKMYPYVCNQVRKKYKLPFKHIFIQQLQQSSKPYQLKLDLLKQNILNFKLQMLIGYNQNTHDNIVWNYLYGWIAYSIDNLLIIQSLNKQRQQKIIPLAEPISVISLSKDMKKLIVGSATSPFVKKSLSMTSSIPQSFMQVQKSSFQELTIANIFIINSQFQIQKKLTFHPKGVQALCISQNNKYIISVGNFKECTIVVWEFPSGKFKASTYTLDKINDIRCLDNQGQGRLLQFMTVGRDQIHFWAFTKQQQLQYCDVFIGKDQQNNLKQLTSCDYIHFLDQIYVIVGTASGQIILLQYGSFNIIHQKLICHSQIVTITSNNNVKRVIILTLEGSIFYWNYNSILKQNFIPIFNIIQLPYPLTAITTDPTFTQGLVGSFNGIYYFNIQENFTSLLIGTFNEEPYMIKIINELYFVSSHMDSKFKIWSIGTGQQIRTYRWKSICTDCIFDQSNNKLICFFKNNNQIKFVNLKKFTNQQIYVKEEHTKSDVKVQDYPIKAFNIMLGGIISKWVVMKKGDFYKFDFIIENKKKIAKFIKIFQINNIDQVIIYNEKSMLFASTHNSQINSYLVDNNDDNGKVFIYNKNYNFTIIDNFKISQTDQNGDFNILISISKCVPETYFAIKTNQQYLFIRNYMKRINLHKLLLNNLPVSISIYEGRKLSDVFVGLKDGSIQFINSTQVQTRYKLQNILCGPISKICTMRSKQIIIIGNKQGIALYKL